MPEWTDFFVAEVGASAALAGLVIVAISINLTRIISYPWLPGRAAETLVAPTGVLVTSSYMLVPHQLGDGWLAGRSARQPARLRPSGFAGQARSAHASRSLVPGIIASLIATVINAWVLLVEILR